MHIQKQLIVDLLIFLLTDGPFDRFDPGNSLSVFKKPVSCNQNHIHVVVPAFNLDRSMLNK